MRGRLLCATIFFLSVPFAVRSAEPVMIAFSNDVGEEILSLTVSTTSQDGPIVNTYRVHLGAGEEYAVNLGHSNGVTGISVELPDARFDFNDPSSLELRESNSVSIAIDDGMPSLLQLLPDGSFRSVPGTATEYLHGADKENAVNRTELSSRTTLSELKRLLAERNAAADFADNNPDKLSFPVVWDDVLGVGHATPLPGESDLATVSIRRRSDGTLLRETLDDLRRQGLRPWRLSTHLKNDYPAFLWYSDMPPRPEDAAESAAAVLEAAYQSGYFTQAELIFVNETTYREVEEGGELSREPLVVIYVSPAVVEMQFVPDCTLLIRWKVLG